MKQIPTMLLFSGLFIMGCNHEISRVTKFSSCRPSGEVVAIMVEASGKASTAGVSFSSTTASFKLPGVLFNYAKPYDDMDSIKYEAGIINISYTRRNGKKFSEIITGVPEDCWKKVAKVVGQASGKRLVD